MRQTLKGFTLIELLVVIAIIAILAAILFPVFAQAKEAAKKVKAVSQMKQVGTSTMLYMGDYDDILPPKVRWGFGQSAGGGDPQPAMTWEKLIQPYTKNWEILMSSEDSRPRYRTPQGQFRRGFSPASNLFTGVQIPSNWDWRGMNPISGSAVPEVSRTVMYGERRQRFYTAANSGSDCANDPWNHECWFWDVQLNHTRSADMPLSDPRAPWGEVSNKYAGGSVYVFADTSARVIKAGGRASDGTLHGTLLPGYEEKAAWWVGTPDGYWDRGVSCLDAPWNAVDAGRQCKLPGQ
jgi:prepilin-type N-terminal cleavage/methylation domain-containing protein